MTRVANDRDGRREDLPRASSVGVGAHEVDTSRSPGPGLMLRRVLDLAVLRGSVVRAGTGGLDRPVTRVNVMEVPDVLPYVRRDELLVTTGYALREDPDRLGPLVRDLHARGVAALGIKLGRYLDELPPAALAAGDELGFPVIQLPASTSYDELLTQVLTAVLDHQAERLTRSESLHRALVQVVLDGGGLQEVATALATILDVRVLLTDPDGLVVVGADQPPPGPGDQTGPGPVEASGVPEDQELMGVTVPWWSGLVPFDLAGRLDADTVRRGRHARAGDEGGFAVVPIVAGRQDHGRIVALATDRSVGPVDLQALERAATVCALAITKEQAVTAVESKYRSDFLRDLLLGRAGGPSRTVPHAQGLGWDMDRPMVVVVSEPDGEDPHWSSADGYRGGRSSGGEESGPLDLRPEVERLAVAWSASIRRRDAAAAVAGFTTEVVAVLGAPGAEDTERWARELSAAVRWDGQSTFSVGVSRIVPGVVQLPTAYEEARRALAVGRQVHGARAVASFDRLGVHRLLSLVPDPAELRSFERETLQELADDTPEAADLRRTLQVLLDTNLNVAQAARALHFHYNTLRYRIAKLERILGPFTTDPLLRLDLALALRVVQMRGIAR